MFITSHAIPYAYFCDGRRQTLDKHYEMIELRKREREKRRNNKSKSNFLCLYDCGKCVQRRWMVKMNPEKIVCIFKFQTLKWMRKGFHAIEWLVKQKKTVSMAVRWFCLRFVFILAHSLDKYTIHKRWNRIARCKLCAKKSRRRRETPHTTHRPNFSMFAW